MRNNERSTLSSEDYKWEQEVVSLDDENVKQVQTSFDTMPSGIVMVLKSYIHIVNYFDGN